MQMIRKWLFNQRYVLNISIRLPLHREKNINYIMWLEDTVVRLFAHINYKTLRIDKILSHRDQYYIQYIYVIYFPYGVWSWYMTTHISVYNNIESLNQIFWFSVWRNECECVECTVHNVLI